ncbi:MAG: RNA methyltransferase [Archaeoglobales archaeon]|jgi:TrmH family RNA methyltransferase|nr:RNA methyltransferase [Archaeoglobales archaeon]TDA26633.1 MAG: RNA methyltransferase [Archaeoglobi archaeon]
MIHVVLVELKIPENVGFIARVVKNFGFERLYLYNCRVTEESFKTAANAKDVLENALTVEDLFPFLSRFNMIVGTTGISGGDYRFFRKPLLTPEELLEYLEGEVAILFGREDFGLLNEEIERCHLLVKIPTSDAYPVMNVSHAAAVLLYILSKKEVPTTENLAKAEEIEILINKVSELLDLVGFPKQRERRELVTLRRVLGRARLRDYELQTLFGIFGKTLSAIERMKKNINNP